MKNFFVGMFLLCLTQSGWGQFQIYPDSSFYTFLDSFYYYHQDDSAEGGLYNQVRRDQLVWGPRLAPHGRMDVANKAMIDYTRAYNAQRNPPTSSLLGPTPIVFPPPHPDAEDWTELGPLQIPSTGVDFNKGIGQTNRIAFHPQYGVNNQVIYAGSHYGGLYCSTNGGAQWENYFTDRGLPITSIGGIATSNTKVFVCTGNGDYSYSNFGINALYQPLVGSVNSYNPTHTQGVYAIPHNAVQANQWQPINDSTTMIDGTTVFPDLLTAFEVGGTMRNIIVHPTQDSVLFIATSQGIFRTVNGGSGWLQVLVGLPNAAGGYFHDTEWKGLEFHPTDPNIVYASGKNIYRSMDKGFTWTLIGDVTTTFQYPPYSIIPSRINIAVTAAAPNSLYAVLVVQGKIVVVSCNNTTSSTPNWVKLTDLAGAIEVMYIPIAVSPTDSNKVYFGSTTVFGNANVGTGFKGQSDYNHIGSHADIHELIFPPYSGDSLFAATHGGVNVKETAFDNLGGWTTLYNGLGVATVWAFDDWEGNENFLATGNQDVGSNVSKDKGNTWSQVLGGDGYGSRIDNHTGDMFVLEKYYEIRRYIIKPLAQNIQATTPFINLPSGQVLANTFPVENHPKDETLYFGFSELYTSSDFCPSFYNFEAHNYNACYHVHIGSYDYPPGPGLNTPTMSFLSCFAAYDGVWHGPDTCFQKLVQPPLTWQKKSDLEIIKPQPNPWERRITEIAFSEDDTTNYTYLATFGNNNPNALSANRRADIYVSNGICDTCFVIKTDSLPYDTLIYNNTNNGDPNPITGIAVDPLNGSRVWASFSGYSKSIKVWYSDNAGNTWQTYDDSFKSLENLNVPINHIVYQRGTKDRLYIATDVGVYVREDGGRWLRMSDNFPNVRTVELKINYCLGKLRVATFGRGVWEVDLLDVNDDYNLRSFRTVSSNETWKADKNMSRDIKVKAGATLTLDSMILNMPKFGLIVVEQGGKLIVNNSTITNLCGETWQGIQVWGNTGLAQTFANQGAILLNSSTVEHARYGVALWQAGNYPNAAGTSGGTGGIILANKSNFINNWRSAEFMKYLYKTQFPITIEHKEKSYFRECLFTVNEDFRGPAFLGHISMWGVGGTQIQGCTFKDERTNKIGDQSIGGSYGIYTIGASPVIGVLPVGNYPPTSFIRNTFEGIERAVEITHQSIVSYGTAIDQCDFVDNEQAVTIRGHDGARVIRNTFQIGGFDAANNTTSFVEEYGLGIIGIMPSFTVEQNVFERTNLSNTDAMVGSWVEGVGGAGNAIRNNDYKNLTGGNIAHGNNDNSADPDDGIQYLCNENLNNSFDFIVFPNLNSNNTTARIGENQGNLTQASRNTLSVPIQTMPDQSQFFNWSFTNGVLNAPVFYHYTTDPLASVSETPDTNLLFNTEIRLASIGNSNFCADNFADPNSPQVTNQNQVVLKLDKLKKRYYRFADKYERLVQNYNSLLDKGNTAALQAEIASTLPQNKNRLKDTLMSISPFLTKETLLQVATCGLYNRNKLKQIIEENPNLVLDPDFMDSLTTCSTPLTANDIDDIKATPKDKLKEPKRTFRRTKLEGKMASAYQELFFWANEVIYTYANDTAGIENDSLEVWILSKPDISSQYELVEHYWRQGRYQDALNLIQQIPVYNKLSKEDLENNQRYEQLKQLLFTAYGKGRTEATLERREVDDLKVIAEKKAGFASVQAGSIIQFFYGINNAYYPSLPNIKFPEARKSQEEVVIPQLDPQIWGYPNPAINWADIQYHLQDEQTEGTFIVTSTNGQTVETIKVNANTGTIKLDTSNWPGGIYFAVLFSNKTKSNVYKLIVRK